MKFVHLRILLIMKTPKKTFDAVKLMRELREQVNKEIANMTPEQMDNLFVKHSLSCRIENLNNRRFTGKIGRVDVNRTAGNPDISRKAFTFSNTIRAAKNKFKPVGRIFRAMHKRVHLLVAEADGLAGELVLEADV